VEKGISDDYRLKIEIGAIQLNIGTQAGPRARNTAVHPFPDPRGLI